jgi:hypothetical protein
MAHFGTTDAHRGIVSPSTATAPTDGCGCDGDCDSDPTAALFDALRTLGDVLEPFATLFTAIVQAATVWRLLQ